MKLVDKLTVFLNDSRVGELSMTPDNTRCVFKYDTRWILEGFSISPIELPLDMDLHIAGPDSFAGNFGIFSDSIPDGYGRYLLSRILRKKGVNMASLSPLQILSIIGESGMGALTYRPETFVGENKALPPLEIMQQLAFNVLSEKSDSDEDVLYFNSGNSGGCRPKCLMKDQDGEWIVKFRHIYDPADFGTMEYDYNITAKKCGITVPDFKLIDNRYFASRRFDIRHGKRIHTATAGALLGLSLNELTMDYQNLLHLTGWLTQDPEQVEQLFRRMVFNIITENKDDHPKNFSFICKSGTWELSPAYDLTLCREGYNGEHATSVMGNGLPGEKEMIKAGMDIKIPAARCRDIIDEISSQCTELKKTYNLP